MTGARDEDLDRAEQVLGVALPTWWRDRLRERNGFDWDDRAGVTGVLYRALPVRDGSDRKRMARTAQDIAWHTERAQAEDSFPAGAVVLGALGEMPAVAVRDDQIWVRRGSLGWEPLGVVLADFAPDPATLPPVTQELPVFTFHPDPVATGMIRRSPNTCPSCDRARGWEYVKTPYGRGCLEHLCPWCIADGSAAQLGASFVDDLPLVNGGVAPDVVAVVCDRTPGITGWQQEVWQVCCADACVYLGPLDVAGALDLPEAVRNQYGLSSDRAELLIESGGGVHRFRCRHCGDEQLWIDLP
ncbi:CbrC family protein [Cellulomonas sp. NPDC089187]|uniref:CbrC family protein n=1 Tax=Cellulomonas sp. NPDC089187 TaxID=3154970 RepID=UPI0034324A08